MVRSYGVRQWATKIVDGLLDPDDSMGDFVGQALSQTDPFLWMDKRVVAPNGYIAAWHWHTGQHWKLTVCVSWQPESGDFMVDTVLDPHGLQAPYQFQSYWVLKPKDLPNANVALKQVCGEFDQISDMKPNRHNRSVIRAAGEEAMLTIDDVFNTKPFRRATTG